MNYQQFKLDRPVIYADMNVYRYVSYGELRIVNSDLVIWSYSNTHLDEIHRNGNKDALDGMRILDAREVNDNLDENFKSVGNTTLNHYVDPTLRYQQHLEAIDGYGGTDDLMIETLIRLFGADNFADLKIKSDSLPDEIDRLTELIDDERKDILRMRAKETSVQMGEILHEHLSEVRPIDKTRSEMGLKSQLRQDIEKSKTPIKAIWDVISPQMGGISAEQFFGFEPNPILTQSGLQHTQHGSLGGAHTILNMLGYSPDTGLKKRDKIRNIMADGQHVGMASYCNYLLSADRRLINKARAIYDYTKIQTTAICFDYKKEGVTIEFGSPKKGT